MPIKVIPNSIEDKGRWTPAGLIRIFNLPKIHECKEFYESSRCETKEEADQLFVKKSEHRYGHL